MAVLGTNTNIVTVRLFTGTGDRPKPDFAGLFTISPASHHYDSSPAYTLKHADERARFTQMRQHTDRDIRSAGILTCFPFDVFG